MAGDGGTRRSALALANPTPRDLQGSFLPYVRNEVLAVQRVFGENARVAVGSGATETLAKTEGPANDVIHIATHYEIDQHDPLRSSLDLAATDVDDGDLMVREVMELSIQANLVVLSGCSTANGIPGIAELPNSDDWVSLTRAFIYAGAPSVVATLWPINDRSTATFMSRFYELLPTHPKSQALSMAQRDLLAGIADPRYRDPYYWAPFVLVGSGR
jgi:CHAT domain-containing protein